MNYKKEVFKGMELLNEHPKTIFMGQAIEYKGTALGMALEGYIPVSMYPRMNFIILAMNQIVNHLDKWDAMSVGLSKPKVIMKAVVGSQYPLDPGHQHKANYTECFRSSCTNIDIIELLYPEQIIPAYKQALNGERSTLIIEHGDLY